MYDSPFQVKMTHATRRAAFDGSGSLTGPGVAQRSDVFLRNRCPSRTSTKLDIAGLLFHVSRLLNRSVDAPRGSLRPAPPKPKGPRPTVGWQTRVRDRRALRRWAFHGAAALLVLGQLFVIHSQVPLGDRQFISPDDGDALRYGGAILKRGLPLLLSGDFAPAGFENDTIFLPQGTIETSTGRFATTRAPGLFYVVAPFSAAGQTGIMVGMEVVFVLSETAIFVLLERRCGGAAGLLGLAAFAFHPSVLFWSWFPRSNLAAVGVLALALLLLDSRQFARNFAGIVLMAASGLFRWEFVLLGVVSLLGWGLLRFRTEADPARWAARAIMAALLAYGFVLGFIWLLYGTIDLNIIIRARGETLYVHPGSAPLGSFEILGQHFREFALVLTLPLVQLLGFSVRRPNGATASLGIAALAMYGYLLLSEGGRQPVFFLQSMTRYIIPVVLVAAVALAGAIAGRGRGAYTVLTLALVVAGAWSGVLFSGPTASGGVMAYMETEAPLVDAANHVPEDAVFLGLFSANALPTRYALIPDGIPDLVQRRQTTVDIVKELIEAGHPVYGNLLRPDYYRSWVDQDPGLVTRVVVPGVLWEAQLEQA